MQHVIFKSKIFSAKSRLENTKNHICGTLGLKIFRDSMLIEAVGSN